jgi:putative ABC transport system permease protein
VLLRTLGASSKQIGKITLIEYFVLGIIGSSVGVILGIILSNLLGVFVFEINITIPFVPAILILLSTGALVTIIGFLSNRSILKTKLIEVIRAS